MRERNLTRNILDVYIRQVVQLHCGIFQLPRCGSGLVELAQPHHLSVLRVLDISHNNFFFGKGRLSRTWRTNHFYRLESRLPNCVDCFKKSKKFKDFTLGLLLLKRWEMFLIHLISEGWVAPLKMRGQALPAVDRATKDHGKNVPGKISYLKASPSPQFWLWLSKLRI